MTASTDRTRELHDQLTSQLEALVTSEDWTAMLATAAKFHRYSARNVLLILSQRPDATRVAGFNRWKEVGRYVRKGERGIAILAPCVYRKADDETDDQGAHVLRGFKVAHVFDIAQTDGAELVDLRPTLLEGEAPAGLFDVLAAQVTAAGFTVERGDCRGANGYTDHAAKIVRVRHDVSDAQAAKTLAHELAHVLLHDGSAYAMGCRGRVEVEAESVAYIVASASGLSTEGYSLPYVAGWAGGDLAVVKTTADRVVATAHAILEAIEVATADEQVAA